VQKNLAFPSHVFRSLFVEQETGRLGKFTANFLLNTVLDFFSLLCTLLEENLSGSRELSLKQQRQTVYSV